MLGTLLRETKILSANMLLCCRPTADNEYRRSNDVIIDHVHDDYWKSESGRLFGCRRSSGAKTSACMELRAFGGEPARGCRDVVSCCRVDGAALLVCRIYAAQLVLCARAADTTDGRLDALDSA